MKWVEKQFFSLLRAGLWDLDVDTSLFEEPIDWQTILEMGRKQTVLGVLADGIAKLPSESRPSKKDTQWLQSQIFKIRKSHLLLNQTLKEVTELLLDSKQNRRLTMARFEKDMTQKDLAERVGISRQTMNAIERGETNPSLKLCLEICWVLGKSLDQLFWEEKPGE